ncbi:MAG TPA: DNA starvation/stationary phase protection protein [Bryobacteraceae bacterium]|jgi:starvation-inducible DNA-binding protein|nr:DNA starvation/stationary phase protection protein [Bryobacteraceae bacterium]
MELQIGLTKDQRQGVITLLRTLLADEYILYTKTRNFHWNVTGPLFHDLHKFFESQYEEIDETIDEIAERIRSLGAAAPGSLAELLALTTLKEASSGGTKSQEMVGALLSDHEAIIVSLRAGLETAQSKFGDAGTADFLTGLMEEHEKMAWMLRSMLE